MQRGLELKTKTLKKNSRTFFRVAQRLTYIKSVWNILVGSFKIIFCWFYYLFTWDFVRREMYKKDTWTKYFFFLSRIYVWIHSVFHHNKPKFGETLQKQISLMDVLYFDSFFLFKATCKQIKLVNRMIWKFVRSLSVFFYDS